MSIRIKTLKRIFLVIMLLFIISTIGYSVNASNGKTTLGEMESQTSSWLNIGKQKAGNIDIGNVVSSFTGLGSILTTIGAGVMVAVATYMGIKFLTSGPEGQAKMKTQLMGLLIAGTTIFGAYFLWKTVVTIANNLFG